MSISDHLMSNESIQASCVDNNFTFYVTDKRVLKHKTGGTFKNEVLHDISFNEISSLSLLKEGASLKWAILGVVLVLSDLWGVSSMYLIVAGVIMILYAFSKRKNYFQFKGSGLLRDKEEAMIWRINSVGARDVKSFVQTVRAEAANVLVAKTQAKLLCT